MKKLPPSPSIIFVHKGFPLYFRIALEHACITQPNTRIIVLTDNVNYKNQISKKHQPHLEFYPIEEYSKSASQFEPLYVHMSPNSIDFELICFKRWFIINEFVKAQNKSNENSIFDFFCCDSDNLVYSDVCEISKSRLEGKTISITNRICPNCTYFTIDSIDFFCSYIMEQYSKTENMNRLKLFYKEKVEKKLGGICDMTMFELLEQDKPGMIHDFGKIQNGHVFDNQIFSAEGLNVKFKTSHCLKQIKFKNKIPYGLYFDSDGSKQKVIFDVLHFNAGSKVYMGKFSFVSFNLKLIFTVKNFSLKRFLRAIIPDFVVKIIKRR